MTINRTERDQIFKEFEDSTESLKQFEKVLDNAEIAYYKSKTTPGKSSTRAYQDFLDASNDYLVAGERFDKAKNALHAYLKKVSQ